MKIYFTRLWAYHQRFFRLYLLLLVAIYGIYLLHLPTPLSLILKPFGIKSWSAGLTRASVRLFHLILGQRVVAGGWPTRNPGLQPDQGH